MRTHLVARLLVWCTAIEESRSVPVSPQPTEHEYLQLLSQYKGLKGKQLPSLSVVKKIIDDAGLVVRKGELATRYPCTADEALYFALSGLIEIAGFITLDRAALGHIKALLECDAGRATISIARLNKIDIARHMGWEPDKIINSCTISFNILPLTRHDVPLENLADGLIR